MKIVKVTELPELEDYQVGDETVFVAVRDGVVSRVRMDEIGDLAVRAALDDSFSKNGKAADARAVGEALEAINQKIEDLHYEPIQINKISVDPQIFLIGSTANSVTISWELNKKATQLIVNGYTVDPAENSLVDNRGYKEEHVFTIRATDEKGKTDEKFTRIWFMNYIYYGGCVVPETFTGAFLNANLKTRKADYSRGSFSDEVLAGEQFVFAIPSWFGEPNFSVDGFSGGFSKVASRLKISNIAGYMEPYDIWVSNQYNLGTITVVVT